MNSRICPPLLCSLGLAWIGVRHAEAQWLTQSFVLNPGWNAVRLHVDASHAPIGDLIGTNGPITEVWAWQPGGVSAGLISTPSQPVSGSDWMRWSRLGGVSSAFSLVANTSYLVRSTNTTPVTWSVKGKPVPPSFTWAASGLNFIGFPTRPSGAPGFYDFLNPSGAVSDFSVYGYPGGEPSNGSPITAQIFDFIGEKVSRGRAFWVSRGLSDNRYFGPFEVSLNQDYRGIHFGQSVGIYTFRLRNQISSTNRLTLTLLPSETSPSGETIEVPALLLRTERNITTLQYSYTNLPPSAERVFVLAPKGAPGSEIDVVLGLDRASMTGPDGVAFAGILRIQDTTLGHLQVDIPVTANQAATGGLWVGNAAVNKVGNYLKSYSKATNQADFNQQLIALEALNKANATVAYSGSVWSNILGTSTSPKWAALAVSADGGVVVAAPGGTQFSRPFVSIDGGATWGQSSSSVATVWKSVAISSDGSRRYSGTLSGIRQSFNSGLSEAWAALPNGEYRSIATSNDGLNVFAARNGVGGGIYRSINGGTNWSVCTTPETGSAQAWQSLVASADGRRVVAAIAGGMLYRSTNAGVDWHALAGAPSANWSSLAMSADGQFVVGVVNGGGLSVSTDGGTTWDAKATAPQAVPWVAVACSTNGNAIVGLVSGGSAYHSSDAGKTWSAVTGSNSWTALAMSADGTRVFGAIEAQTNAVLKLIGVASTPALTWDPLSGRVMGAGKYLQAGFDTALGDVPASFPLRIILHQGSNGVASLLRQVFIGPDANTNTIIARQQSALNPSLLAQARRITAVHLPIASAGGWTMSGTFGGTGIMETVVTEVFDNSSSNPFVHAYHPDHDNKDALYQSLPRGSESYDVRRQITLSFTPPPDDFASRTVGSSRVQGVYLENIVLKGGNNQVRTIVTQGTFVLNRISPIASIQ